jgi:hypothetical protein
MLVATERRLGLPVVRNVSMTLRHLA